VEAVRAHLAQGYTQVLDADLTAYFDSIPHDRLLAAVARRIADRHILRLLTAWLRAPVVVERADGKRETRGGKRTRRGTPQGGGISPLLANLYLHAFDTAWRAGGLERRWQARLIRYADDFVICCRAKAKQVQPVVAAQLQTLGLTLNSAKTRVLDARQEAVTFLGFTLRVVRSRRTGRTFPLVRPSAPACQRLRDAVKAQTSRAHLARPTADVITALNRLDQGWAGYFQFQHCGRAFSALRRFVSQRVRIYLRHKHRTPSWGYQAFPDAVLYGRLGLYRLPGAPAQAPASASR